jgi:HEAT repeat protein
VVTPAADPSPAVRVKALVALGFSDDPRATAVIDAARSDPDQGVRDTAKARENR